MQKNYGIRLSKNTTDKLLILGTPFVRKYLESIAVSYDKCTNCSSVALATAFENGVCRNCKHGEDLEI